MAAPVGELAIDLRARTAKFQNDLGKAQRKLDQSATSMKRSMQRIERATGRAIGNMIRFNGAILSVAGIAGLGLLNKQAVETTDAMGKAASKIGVTAEALQELRFAAGQSGVAQNTLDMALQRFSRRVGEAAQGSGELRGTLEEYGVAVKNADGSTRAVTEVFADFADAIAGAGSSQEQLRIAFKGFDSEGAALVNLMRGGSRSVEDFRKQARDLGLVLSNELVAGTEAANDALSILDQQLAVRLKKGLLGLTPIILQFKSLWVNIVEKIAEGSRIQREMFKNAPSQLPQFPPGGPSPEDIGLTVGDGLPGGGGKSAVLKLLEGADPLLLAAQERTRQIAEAAERARNAYLDLGLSGDDPILLAAQERARQITDEAAKTQASYADLGFGGADDPFLLAALERTRQLTEDTKKLQTAMRNAETGTRQFASVVSSGLAGGIAAGNTFDQILRNIIRSLVQATLQATLLNSITSIFGVQGGAVPPVPMNVGNVAGSRAATTTNTTINMSNNLTGASTTADARIRQLTAAMPAIVDAAVRKASDNRRRGGR